MDLKELCDQYGLNKFNVEEIKTMNKTKLKSHKKDDLILMIELLRTKLILEEEYNKRLNEENRKLIGL